MWYVTYSNFLLLFIYIISFQKIEIDSPYLPVKSRGVFTLKQHTFQKNNIIKLNSSILTKKPRIQETYTKNVRIYIIILKIVYIYNICIYIFFLLIKIIDLGKYRN